MANKARGGKGFFDSHIPDHSALSEAKSEALSRKLEVRPEAQAI